MRKILFSLLLFFCFVCHGNANWDGRLNLTYGTNVTDYKMFTQFDLDETICNSTTTKTHSYASQYGLTVAAVDDERLSCSVNPDRKGFTCKLSFTETFDIEDSASTTLSRKIQVCADFSSAIPSKFRSNIGRQCVNQIIELHLMTDSSNKTEESRINKTTSSSTVYNKVSGGYVDNSPSTCTKCYQERIEFEDTCYRSIIKKSNKGETVYDKNGYTVYEEQSYSCTRHYYEPSDSDLPKYCKTSTPKPRVTGCPFSECRPDVPKIRDVKDKIILESASIDDATNCKSQGPSTYSCYATEQLDFKVKGAGFNEIRAWISSGGNWVNRNDYDKLPSVNGGLYKGKDFFQTSGDYTISLQGFKGKEFSNELKINVKVVPNPLRGIKVARLGNSSKKSSGSNIAAISSCSPIEDKVVTVCGPNEHPAYGSCTDNSVSINGNTSNQNTPPVTNNIPSSEPNYFILDSVSHVGTSRSNPSEIQGLEVCPKDEKVYFGQGARVETPTGTSEFDKCYDKKITKNYFGFKRYSFTIYQYVKANSTRSCDIANGVGKATFKYDDDDPEDSKWECRVVSCKNGYKPNSSFSPTSCIASSRNVGFEGSSSNNSLRGSPYRLSASCPSGFVIDKMKVASNVESRTYPTVSDLSWGEVRYYRQDRNSGNGSNSFYAYVNSQGQNGQRLFSMQGDSTYKRTITGAYVGERGLELFCTDSDSSGGECSIKGELMCKSQ